MENKTYIPLYRKYRPQTFADVVGQEHVVSALSNAIKLNKIAHAFLFCGPRGTGKTSMARILAKSLNCIEGPTLTPCGKCPSCIDILNSIPKDVIEIDAASNRNVEDTQNILEKIQYAPVNGKFKIYVIDEVHMLSNHAFNALLKTLEEPPKNVIFILATTEAHKVLETIISRCQRYDFRRIQISDIVKRLREISDIEKININDDALHIIAQNSTGGMRDALSLLDQLSVLNGNSDKPIDASVVNELLGKISIEDLYDFTNEILLNNIEKLIENIHKMFDKGMEPLRIVNNLIEYFRNILIIKNGKDLDQMATLTLIDKKNIEKIQTQVENLSNEKIIYIIEKLSYYSREIKNATNRYLWLELCIIDVVSVEFSSISDLVEKVNKLEAFIQSGDFKNNVSSVSQPVLKPSFETVKKTTDEVISKPQIEVQMQQQEEIVDKSNFQEEKQEVEKPAVQNNSSNENYHWRDLLKHIESMPSRAFYSSLAHPICLSKEKVAISFKKDIFVKQARDKNKSQAFYDACKKYFGVDDIEIDVKLKNDTLDEKIHLSEISENNEKSSPEPQIHAKEEKISQSELETLNDEQEKGNSFEQNTTSSNTDLSDQEKMVVELFDGKIIS